MRSQLSCQQSYSVLFTASVFISVKMSLRALRKLRGDQGELNLPEPGEQIDDDEEDDDSPSPKVKGANRFDLLVGGSLSESEVKEDDDMLDAGDSEKQGGGGGSLPQSGSTGAKRKQRKKKKKKGHAHVAASSEDHMDNDADDIDSIVREVNAISGEKVTQEDKEKNIADRMVRTLLCVEHKHMNPQNEMKRIFGSRVVQAENNRRRGRGGRSGRSTWIVQGQPHWLHYPRPGLSMSVVESVHSCQVFKYEHSVAYQQTQFKFLDAVESLNPENIMALLNQEPFHVDTLLQVSDIFRLGDDSAMAAQLLERSLYVLESAAHPLFNMTTGTCRLYYNQQENRSFFIALFRHILNVGRQGCYRTALELCKLLLSLSPDEDPLAVALMIDFYALKAQQYAWLVQFYHHYESSKNLSMLPNFAYSIPLALYHLSIGSDTATQRDKREETKAAAMMKDLGSSPAELRSQADTMLQEALIMFPGLLMPLLDKCSVQPDPQVATDTYLGPQAQDQQSKGLSLLVNLYIGRCYHTWKEPDVISWLEENVQVVLGRTRSGDSAVCEAETKRSTRYQGTPIPIYRHILIAEVANATAALPQHLAHTPVMSYDPLPPSDSVCGYIRPPSEDRGGPNAANSSSILTTFFRSLMPNYDPNAPEPQLGEVIEGEGAAAGDGAGGGELRASVNTLLDAMRDLLANIHLPEPQVNDADESEDENREWD